MMFNQKKPKKAYKWPLFNERVRFFKNLSGKEMSLERLHGILEADTPYFTIDLVISKHVNTSIVTEISKSFEWKKMEGCLNTDGEQLYAWMCKKGNGKFKNIEFGTIQEFETIVLKNINNKTGEL